MRYYLATEPKLQSSIWIIELKYWLLLWHKESYIDIIFEIKKILVRLANDIMNACNNVVICITNESFLYYRSMKFRSYFLKIIQRMICKLERIMLNEYGDFEARIFLW